MSQFVHLHLHTQYSLLDGCNRIVDVVEHAHKLGQPAIAMTDHGSMHGAIEFYEQAKKVGIKPIIGCELYLNPVSRHERTPKIQGGAPTHHLTVLAQDQVGYRNLCKLVTLAHKEGFYHKPRVDHQILQEFNAGLIVLSGCLNGELSAAVRSDDTKNMRRIVERYLSVFGDRFYLEIQPHKIPEQQKHNQACVALAKEFGIPLVATNDCHYLEASDHLAQEVLMCISTGKLLSDPDHLKHEGVTLSLKTVKELSQEFGAESCYQEAIKNSVEIAKRCDLSFETGRYHMPQFESKGSESLEQLLKRDAHQGLEKRMEIIRARDPQWSEGKKQIYLERLGRELVSIEQMGFAGYFLIVADFINWAKEQGIPVGPGRGSAAGSLVAYALRIVEIDPILNKLLFERFLNPERVSLPDIDVDFCIYGRDRVIQYVIEKYGSDHVAQIATFGTLKAKAAIKDVGRVLGRSFAEMDRVAQLIPAPRQGFDFSLKESLKMEKRLADYAAGEGKEVISLALRLEGLTRHASTHAAGVVVGDRPLVELLPLMVDKDGNDVTQYSMKYVEKLGLLKFDFLGLKTLTVLDRAVKLIEAGRGIRIDLNSLPLDDAKTYELLCSGNTVGVFQLEGGGMTDITMRIKPSCFDDLAAINALFRPGPLDAGMADRYIERKHGREQVEYLHPKMKKYLEDTYGIIVYQEQVMQMAQELAGYSLGEADLLRRAMGKKNPVEMEAQKDRFTSGCIANGVPRSSTETIFEQIETFSRYGFNRSHAAAYGMVTFQTAYLKSHFPVEFMAALMSEEIDDSDKVLKNLTECRKHGIKVLPPDVNHSVAGFSVSKDAIRYGLSAVKGVGEKAVQAVTDARTAGGSFKSLEDFASRVDLQAVNKRVFEGFVKCGAFDFSGTSRADMIGRLDEVVKGAQLVNRDRNSNQVSLFGDLSIAQAVPRRTQSTPEWPILKKLAFERESLGFYISGHPLEQYRSALKRMGAVPISELRGVSGRSEVQVGGVVTALKLRNTKKGDRYAAFVLEDYQGTVESIAWPDTYAQVSTLIVADEPVVATGRVDQTEERCTLIISKLESLLSLRDRNATQGVLIVTENDSLDRRAKDLLRLFTKYPGNCPVRAKLQVGSDAVSLLLRDESEAPICVTPSEKLCEEVEQLFGRPVLSFL